MGNILGKNGKKALLLGGFAAGLFLVFKYLFPLAAPFLLAFLIVYLSNPWLSRVQEKTHIRKEILLGGLLLLLAALLIAGAWGLVSWGTVHAADIGNSVEKMQQQMNGALRNCCIFLESRFGMDAGHTEKMILEKLDVLTQNMQTDALPRAAKQSLTYFKNLAAAGAFLGVGLISSMLLCRDYENIVERMEGNPVFDTVWQFVEKTVSLIGGYLKAQAVILFVISMIAIAGLLIGRVGGAIVLGILAGILDALPFIGTGIVLIPTALWQLLCGNFRAAAAAALSYVLCIAARELLEPRLLGKQVGMYPVIMLLSVYAGVKLFGLTGIFLGPLYAVLFREGVQGIKEIP